MDRSLSRILKLSFILILSITAIYILVEAKQFLYPLALSTLFAYLLFPIVSVLENKVKLPRFFAILISILLAVAFIYFVGNLFLHQIRIFVKDFPEIKRQALENIGAVQIFIESKFNYTIEDQQILLEKQLAHFFDLSNSIFSDLFKAATGTLTKLFFIPIFTFFMLFYRNRAKTFILRLTAKKGNITGALLDQISKVTIKYVAGVLTVVSILAVSHSVALSIIGVKYAVFLGILAALISIIPYFGTLASTLIPLTFSLILTNNPYEPLWIIIYYLLINSVENNILTPLITGGNVSLNPLITILGLIAGAMIWGIPGMIVAIPGLGVVKIICDNVEALKPFGYILGVDKRPNKLEQFTEKITKKSE